MNRVWVFTRDGVCWNNKKKKVYFSYWVCFAKRKGGARAGEEKQVMC